MSQYYVPCGSDQVAFRSDGNAATLACWSRGLYNYTNAPEISASLDDDPTKVWSPAELLAIAFAHPPNFPPGTAYEYCNTNYALLGLMAEKIDGKPLAVVSLAYRNQDEPPRGLRSVAFRTFKDGKY